MKSHSESILRQCIILGILSGLVALVVYKMQGVFVYDAFGPSPPSWTFIWTIVLPWILVFGVIVVGLLPWLLSIGGIYLNDPRWAGVLFIGDIVFVITLLVSAMVLPACWPNWLPQSGTNFMVSDYTANAYYVSTIYSMSLYLSVIAFICSFPLLLRSKKVGIPLMIFALLVLAFWWAMWQVNAFAVL